ncbi:MAG: hypothetical protein ACI9FN_001945 [Saprospiraceae bacterium]|jgi:hypothetical protein
MKNYTLFCILFCILLFSCEDENHNDIASNQFVVEGFIYAGEPIDDIRIKSTFPLTDEEDTSAPINDAEVSIIKDGQSYSLLASGQDGYYNYPDSDVSVETGDLIQLEVISGGIMATAETRVPTSTMGLHISQDTIVVPKLPLTQGREAIVMTIREFVEKSSITATWDNPNGDLHFMVVEAVSDTLDPIFIDQVLSALEGFRFVSEPTDASSLNFLSGSVESFGTYSVKVYHINEEYAALYENSNQDSRDLNEPPSNVQNALGVFSAFNSQEVFFEVVRDN